MWRRILCRKFALPIKWSGTAPENCYLLPPLMLGAQETAHHLVARRMRFIGACIQALMVAAIQLLGGCASIMSGRQAEVAFDSFPSMAQVVVRDRRGQEVASVRTPGRVTLKRKERFIFPARYTASIEAPGYRGEHVPIRATVNPWILGNVVFGGIPGLVIDNVTGAVWKPRDALIYRQLEPVVVTQEASALPATHQIPRPGSPSRPPSPHVAAVPAATSVSPSEAQPAVAGPLMGSY